MPRPPTPRYKHLPKVKPLHWLCLTLLVAGASLPAQAQQDSLWTAWRNVTAPDSARANALHDFIQEGSFYSNTDSALLLLTTLYDFTVAKRLDRATVDALAMQGYVYFRTGRYPEALSTYRRGVTLAKKVDYRLGLANIYMRTGYIYHDNEDILGALPYYKQSLALFEALGDKDGISSINNEFGSIYRGQGEYDKALEFYQKGLAVLGAGDMDDRGAAIYTNMAGIYAAQDKPRLALEYYEKGLAISRRLKDQLGISSALSGIASTYAETGREAEALGQLRESLSIELQIGNTLGASYAQIEIADLLVDRGEFREALVMAKAAYAGSLTLGDIGNLESAAGLLSEIYKERGMLSEALEYRELQSVYADSLKGEETAKGLQLMEFRTQLVADSLRQNEKDLELALAHQAEVQEKVNNRNIAIGASVVFLLLAGGFFSRWRYVRKSRAVIQKEKDRSENLLLNILPAEIAEELKATGEATARDFDMVSVMFTDFKGFTEQSATLTATELLGEINHCFGAFDLICERHGVEKIKTIGDAYMAAGGLPVFSEDAARNTALAALEMQDFISARLIEQRALGLPCFEMRLGIHTGPVVAGIVGVKKFQYDIWGDTVNTAARMESAGEVGRVNVSAGTYEMLKDDAAFAFEARGLIEAKGKGKVEMWFLKKGGV